MESSTAIAETTLLQGLKLGWTRVWRGEAGYDYFISYRWSDGSQYAIKLEENLSQEGLICFLDRKSNPPGEPLREGAEKALRTSTVLILVASPESLQSFLVEEEVTFFAQFRRTIFPIDIGGTLKNCPTHPILEALGDTVRAEEDHETLSTGPSERILGELKTSLGLHSERHRQKRRQRNIVSLLSAFFLIILVVSGIANRNDLLADWERDRKQSIQLARKAGDTPGDQPRQRLSLAVSAVNTTWQAHRQTLPAAEEELRYALDRIQGRTQAHLSPPSNPEWLSQLLIHPEGDRAVMTTGTAELKMVDLTTGTEQSRSTRASNSFADLVWEQRREDPPTVLAVDLLGDVWRWTAGGEAEHIFSSRGLELQTIRPVHSLALAPDQSRLALGESEGEILIVELGEENPHPLLLDCRCGLVEDVVFLEPDVLVSSGRHGQVLFWELKTLRRGGQPQPVAPRLLHQVPHGAWRMARQPGTSQIAVGALTGSLVIVDLDQDGTPSIQELPSLTGPSTPLRFLSNGQLLVADGSNAIYLFDLTSPSLWPEVFSGHDKEPLDAWMLDDGPEMVSVDRSGEVRHWQVGWRANDREPRTWRTCTRPAEPILFDNREGALLNCVEGVGGVLVLRENRETIYQIEGFSDPRALAGDPAGTTLLVQEGEMGPLALVEILEAVGARQQREMQQVLAPVHLGLLPVAGEITTAEVLPQQVVVGFKGGELVFWPRGEQIGPPSVLHRHLRPITELVSTRDWLVSLSQDQLLAWPVQYGDAPPEPLPLYEHARLRWPIAVDPAGLRMITGDQDGRSVVWSLETEPPQPLRVDLASAGSSLYAAAVDRRGQRFAIAGSTREIRVWELDLDGEARQFWSLQNLASGILDLDWSEDGHYLAVSTTNSPQVVIWNLAVAPPEPRTLPVPGHSSSSGWSAHWWLGDRFLLTASADGTVRNWRIGIAPLLEEARRRTDPPPNQVAAPAPTQPPR